MRILCFTWLILVRSVFPFFCLYFVFHFSSVSSSIRQLFQITLLPLRIMQVIEGLFRFAEVRWIRKPQGIVCTMLEDIDHTFSKILVKLTLFAVIYVMVIMLQSCGLWNGRYTGQGQTFSTRNVVCKVRMSNVEMKCAM